MGLLPESGAYQPHGSEYLFIQGSGQIKRLLPRSSI